MDESFDPQAAGRAHFAITFERLIYYRCLLWRTNQAGRSVITPELQSARARLNDKYNGALLSLSTMLKAGDIFALLTAPDPAPAVDHVGMFDALATKLSKNLPSLPMALRDNVLTDHHWAEFFNATRQVAQGSLDPQEIALLCQNLPAITQGDWPTRARDYAHHVLPFWNEFVTQNLGPGVPLPRL